MPLSWPSGPGSQTCHARRRRESEQDRVGQHAGGDAGIEAGRGPAQQVERQKPATGGDDEAGHGGDGRPDHVAGAHGGKIERHGEAEETVGRADDAEVEAAGCERRGIVGEEL